MPFCFIMSCSLPLCCVMGTCTYEVFHWQRVFQAKRRGRLPSGVYDDTYWTPSDRIELDTEHELNPAVEYRKHNNPTINQKRLSIWSPCDEVYHSIESHQDGGYQLTVEGRFRLIYL